MAVEDQLVVMQQELLTMQRQNAALATQVQRLQRSINLDEREFAVGQQQSNREVIVTMGKMTEAVGRLIEQKEKENTREEENVFSLGRSKRAHEVENNLEHIRRLSYCRQTVVPECDCTEHAHKGLRFVDMLTGQVLEENMCPKTWWIKQSRLAFKNGNLQEFTESTDLRAYLSMYKKQT